VTSVANADGCVANSADISGTNSITINPRPRATLTSTNFPSLGLFATTNCNVFTPYTITNLLTGVGPWTVTWNDGVVQTTNAAAGASVALLRTVIPFDPSPNAPSNNIYYVTNVANSNGCSANPGDIFGTNVITVNPRPASTLISLDATNCNSGLPYDVKSRLTGFGPWIISWSDGTRRTNNTATPGPVTNTYTVFPTNNSSANVSSVSVYYVTNLTDANNCAAATGTDLIGTNTVRVNPRPTATLNPDVTLSGEHVLPNKQFSFHVNALVGQRVIIQRSTNLVSWVSIATNEVATAGGFDFADPSSTNPPYGTYRALGSFDKTICNGNPTALSVALTGKGPWNVTWFDGVTTTNHIGVGGLGTTGTDTLIVSPSATTTYTVTALTDANCTAQAGDVIGSDTITVNPRPSAAVSVLFNKTTFCNGDSTVVQAVLTGGGPPWTVTWASNNVVVAVHANVTSPDSLLVSPVNTLSNSARTVTYTVSALSGTSCPAGPGDLLSSAVLTINPRPTFALITTNLPTICDGGLSAIPFRLTGLPASTNLTVQWADGFNQTNLSIGTNTRLAGPLIGAPNTPTNYSFWATNVFDPDSCAGFPSDVDSRRAQVTVDPVPASPPTNNGDVTSCFDVAVKLSVSVPAGFTADWYADATRTNLLLVSSTNYIPAVPVPGAKPVTNYYYVAARYNDTNALCESVNATVVRLISVNCTNHISITKTPPNSVSVDWYGNYVLQHATNLTAPNWITLTQYNQVGPHSWSNSTAPPPAINFFRLAPTNAP
jgi:hypothetical protein